MTLKKQKIIKYIPIIQFITTFCWIRYYQKNNLPYSAFFKSSLKTIVFLLAINIPRMILHIIFQNELLDSILYYMSIYPCFFGVATIAVSDQEQHEKSLKSKDTNKLH